MQILMLFMCLPWHMLPMANLVGISRGKMAPPTTSIGRRQLLHARITLILQMKLDHGHTGYRPVIYKWTLSCGRLRKKLQNY